MHDTSMCKVRLQCEASRDFKRKLKGSFDSVVEDLLYRHLKGKIDWNAK